MPVSPTYPGVYVQEVPSGVRTIVGVGTSVALFIGRARSGPLGEPIQCLNFGDFERAFTSLYAESDLAREVRLFFQNGGTQCYVMRIADALAAPATVTLMTEAAAATPSLIMTAKSAGVMGNDIRLRVDYNTLQPESTFNLEAFRWSTTSGGAVLKSDQEVYLGLSMDPNSPRYAPDIISQNSSLVEATDALPAAAAPFGISQSGRAVSERTTAIFRTQWMTLLGAASLTNRFRIGVDGHVPVEIDLSTIDFTVAPLNTGAGAVANLAGRIQQIINNTLTGGATVAVSFQAGPTGPVADDNATTVYLRIASASGDVIVEPAAANDLAVPLMLGTAQGGLEISKFALKRPAPSGLFFDRNDLVAFAQLPQVAVAANGFDRITIGLVALDLTGPNQLTTSPIVAGARLYHDATATTENNGPGGVREKWAIIASAINTQRAGDPTFGWTAEVWGSRLALIPALGGDNTTGVVNTSRIAGGGTDLTGSFTPNVRYYSLGLGGSGAFQTAGAPGNNGGPPQLSDYAAAYDVVDREVDLFNLLILPKDEKHTEATTMSLWGPASDFCQRRRAFLLMDPRLAWTSSQKAVDPSIGVNSLRVGLAKSYSAVFYPRITINEGGKKINVGPSGAIAGLMARIDSTRGVWKAPAGTEADLRGVVGLERQFSDGENGVLNPKAVNTIRIFPNGIVNWGARTMDGDDSFGSEYKYIPVRRLALFLEESLYRGLKWVVFEPNDEPLWAQIRLNVGAFMHNLFRQGAFQGTTPRVAYFVKCDAETTTQNDINLGIVNVWVGFAPLKPAEFVILYLQQMAGQIQT